MADVVGERVVDPTLLPDYAAWAAVNPGISLHLYVSLAVQLDYFFATGSIFWPQFIRHEGGLFLAEGFSVTNFETWLSRPTDLNPIERVMNHRYMRDLLRSLDDAPWPILISAGALVEECWEARLNQLCPDVAAKVEGYQSDNEFEMTVKMDIIASTKA